MIGPKTSKPSKADEREAYRIATARDSDTCQRCLRDCGPRERDHRQNRQPGNTVPSNLQILGGMGGCHHWKSHHPAEALRDGWSVPSWADPAKWPAARWFRGEHGIVTKGFVLYDDEGRFREITAERAAEITDGMVT